jgi:hypothetical protein
LAFWREETIILLFNVFINSLHFPFLLIILNKNSPGIQEIGLLYRDFSLKKWIKARRESFNFNQIGSLQEDYMTAPLNTNFQYKTLSLTLLLS